MKLNQRALICKTSSRHRQQGFTIIELLIAMTIFALIMLLISTSIIQITRVYYKGLTNSKTQETARAILQDVSQAIQFNGGSVSSSSNVLCVGTRRYTFDINAKVSDDPPATHGLVVDDNGTCSTASRQDLTAIDPTDAELLIPRTRLGKFSVVRQGTTNLYEIKVRVVYGDDDLLEDKLQANGTPGTDGVLDTCTQQVRFGTQFCAVSELSTIVQQRVQ